MKREFVKAGLVFTEDLNINKQLNGLSERKLLPYSIIWEFPRENLKLGKEIGYGAFAVVLKAEAYGICIDAKVTTVAVKVVKNIYDFSSVKSLISELKTLARLKKHINIISLLGACTKNIMSS